MKILIADDEEVTRKLLQALLTKVGHEVEVVNDGDAAWKALERPDAPPLAILDWMMPGLSGVDVCKKLRTTPSKSRTYVLLLSAKSQKEELIAGRDAGADDYLVKPFDPMELLARLRVAQRMIDHQQTMQQHIVAVDREAIVDLLTPEQLSRMLVRGVAEIGFGNATILALGEIRRTADATFTAWSPLVLINDGLWLDLLLDVTEESAFALFKTLLGRTAVSERELLDFLAETANILGCAIKAPLIEQGSVVLTPVISCSIRTAALTCRPPPLAEQSRHRLSLPEIVLEATIIKQPAPVVRKSFGALHEMDILAESLPSSCASEVFLLNQGVMLNTRYIEKLAALAQSQDGAQEDDKAQTDDKDLRVAVVEPSRLAEFFCTRRIAGGP